MQFHSEGFQKTKQSKIQTQTQKESPMGSIKSSQIPPAPPLLISPPVLKVDPYLKQLMAKNCSNFKSKTEQMQNRHPPVQSVNPSLVTNRIYPEQQLQPQDKSLFTLCQTCNNWLKNSELQYHARCHASHIDQGLYLGSSINSSNIRELRRLKILSILNCTVQIPNTFYDDSDFSYKRLTLSDTIGQSIRPYFDECIQFIRESLKNGKNVLVHCAMGKSRSATIVIIYMMIAKKMNLKEAYEFVKSKRSIITPNPSYVKQLLQVQYEMFGSNSIKPEQIKAAYKHIQFLNNLKKE